MFSVPRNGSRSVKMQQEHIDRVIERQDLGAIPL